MKYNDNGTWKDIYVKTLDSLPTGAVIDYTGDTLPDGWVEYNDYSTDEVDTGKTWIDGKKIYRKVISGVPASKTDLNISNIGTIVTFDFKIVRSNGGVIPNGYWYDSTNYVSAEVNDNQIQVYGPYISNSYTFRAILEYTKTTD